MKAFEQQLPTTSSVANNPNSSLPRSIKRRQFLKSAAFIGAAGLILPRFKLFGADAPSNKLNIALIATGHRAQDHFDVVVPTKTWSPSVIFNEKTSGCRRREISQGQALRGLAQVP